MTGQPQASFDRCLADARAWMEAVQERLRLNDNTQGPRAALEARLRETEKICQMEPEGNMKVELVLQAAEALLACCPEDKKSEILGQLRDVKAEWEDTATYMMHCHSRIEWVWLHWSEFLLARDEFYHWFQKMEAALEPPAELQLGLREKQWQLSHTRVLWAHVCQQAKLLERLLEEAEALFNRLGDPSVDEDMQKHIKAQFDAVKDKAQDRVEFLEQITQEHEHFQTAVEEVQLWLKALVDKANSCLGPDSTLTTKDRLLAVQDIAQDFPSGEESLRGLEEQAVAVIRNTSPLGAQKITEELERMRKVLEKLQQLSEDEQGRLQALLESEEAWESQAGRLEAELADFSKVLQRLAQDGLQSEATQTGSTEPEATQPGTRESDTEAYTEDELVARWRRYSALRTALSAEEPRVHQLEAQLKELASLPHGSDPEPLSRALVTAVQEFQRLKRKSTRLRNVVARSLLQRFQRHLEDLQLWKDLAQKLLDITANLPDQASIHTFLPQIEASLAESCCLKERLLMLPLQAELLDSVFGPERATALLEEVTSSMRDRDLLHNSLLQRKSKLQSLLAQHQDFAAAFQSLEEKFLDLRGRIQARKGLQRDLPGKQVQLLKLQGLQEEALALGAQVEATRPFIQGNPQHQQLMDQLSMDFQALQRSLEGLVESCRQNVRRHCAFSHQLQELWQWVTVATQKLESHMEDMEPWGAEPREAEVEELLAQFPEKEAQLSLLQGLGSQVVASTSPEGGSAVQEELRRLQEKLLSLLRIYRLRGAEAGSPPKTVFTKSIPRRGFLPDPAHPIPRPAGQAGQLQEDEGDHGGLLQHQEDADTQGGLPQPREDTRSRGRLPQPQEDASSRGGLPQTREDGNGRGGLPQPREDGNGRGGLPQPREDADGCGGLPQLLRNFQQWLQVENAELAKISAARMGTAKDMRTRGTRLQELETRVLDGQKLFEDLLQLGPEGASPEELEDLRYQWMLYKSKLEDAGHLLAPTSPGQPAGFQKAQKVRQPRSIGSFPQRVWCAALPLQLLLLLFLLLLLLLPAGDEGRSCTRANNFARSFRLMLRYSGPPPT